MSSGGQFGPSRKPFAELPLGRFGTAQLVADAADGMPTQVATGTAWVGSQTTVPSGHAYELTTVKLP